MVRLLSHSQEDTLAIGKALGRTLRKGDVIAFRGDLAAGKTTLSRGLIQSFLPHTRVKSPTYSIMNVYTHPELGELLHIDAYRLREYDDLNALGFDLYEDSFYIALIEWSENIPAVLEGFKSVIYVTIEKDPRDENVRSVTVRMPQNREVSYEDLSR